MFEKEDCYQPKGGMCASCAYLHHYPCHTLDFKAMQVIEKYKESGVQHYVVKCTKFERISEVKND